MDRCIFLSGGIFTFIDGLAVTAHAHGFAGKVRIEVIARELLDEAVKPLADDYDEAELERAVQILGDAIDRIGRRFYADQYEDDCADHIDDQYEDNPTLH